MASKLKYTWWYNSEENGSEEYNFIISNNKENLIFTLENLESIPSKIYELEIKFIELKKQNKNLVIFHDAEKLMTGIKKCIDSKNYLMGYNKEENCFVFELKNDIFDNGVLAKLKIPEKEQSLESKVKCLTKIVANLRSQLKKSKSNKEETAVNSFKGTSILNNEEKKLISNWIDQKKTINFYLLFSTDKDGDSSSTFHAYCDGVFPTVTIVLDTLGRKFGGYSTQNWSQSTIGQSCSRAPCSFIFNLSYIKKYDLIDQLSTSAIYRSNSNGPNFGGNDLSIASGCTSNTNSFCNKSAYNTGNNPMMMGFIYNTENNNLLGISGSTNFQVTKYEVFKVVFE